MSHRVPSVVRRSFGILGVVVVIGVLSGLPVFAAEPWEGPAFSADPAALLRAASALPDSGESIDVLLLETVRSFDAAGRETYTQRFVYRFTDDQAHESWSALEHSWSPWNQERPRLRARVITPDGAEHLLDPATIAENGEAAESPDMFEDGRVLRAPLPAIGPGAIVEQEVTVRETAPFFEGGTVDSSYFQISVPMRRVRLVLEAPAGLPLRWMVRSTPGMPEIAPREESSNGLRRLVFEAAGVPAYGDTEPGLPPEIPRWTHVSFSTGSSWSDLARRYSDIVDRAIQGSNLSAFLKTTSPAGSQVETINRLLSRLRREVRYTGVELGEAGVMPRTPTETLKRKFGDCKDKAVLLTALLRALDIPAYVALLNAAEGEPDVEASLPGLGNFNHAIVMVPGNPAVWIDPTDPYARAGELPIQDQGRLALVASPTATALVPTPETGSADNREVETREIFLADLGGARVIETTEYRGVQEQELRAAYADSDRDDTRTALEEYAGETYLAEELTDFDHSDPEDLSQPFRLRLEMAGAARGTTDIREAVVAIFLSSFAERLPEELTAEPEEGEQDGEQEEARQHDYLFTRPMQLEARYRIVPPAGYTARPVPPHRARKLGSGKLEEVYTLGKDGAVEAVISFDTGKRRISPAEYQAMRDGLRQLSTEKPVMLTFDQVGESHLAAGRMREALDEFRRLASQAPKAALPRTRTARALLAGGLGAAARQEAEAATKLEPELAYAWVTLGWLRQHDDIGRRFGKGFDRAGAIDAYRRAMALQPANTEARGDLAILLEHDAEGIRYTAGADIAGAVEEYEAMKDDLEGLGLPNNLEIALMWAQRWEEMKEQLDSREDDEVRATLRLVLLAATEGTEAALQNAERAFTDSDARSNALAGAGRNLMLMRRYAEAAALFERAGRQSTRAAALLGTAEVLRKTRRHEDLGITSKDPVGAYRRMTAASLTSPEVLAKLMSKEITRGMSSAERQAFWEDFENGVKGAVREAREDMPVEVAIDLALAVMRETVSGDDSLGYRIALTATAGDERRTGYVIPEDGEYRIAAFDRALWLIGGEALRRLERNDLSGARQWLDWAHEELDKGAHPDPFQSSAFVHLWTKGLQGDAEQVRCAAASLLSFESTLSQTLPILTACRQAASATSEAPRQAALDRALLAAYLALGRHEEAASTASRLAETSSSETLFRAQMMSLTDLQRWDDMRRLADARLARMPGDVLAQDAFAEVAMRKGDFDEAERIVQRILDSGKATAHQYNEAAWIALIRGRTDERVLELAQRAASLSNYEAYGILHTLATVYAEQGKTAEAYRIILQALELKGEPDLNDLYVFGRLAEHYGLPDAARLYYEKAGAQKDAGDDANPMDTIHLVRKRLEALGKAPKQVATRR